ncbi:Pentatricopeptide repeat-containing protein -chloroplastic [Striga hermonthica]|uniref:Pentatricopeptide repeat-containing protein -chloroplastic n=1 Tax=Striga hermonthica TaxID=68872 RepID=A0A9N7P2P8_STRHE|nr:Pentatricopeptide repeat-containing protein -chloroplastic [Striga hermonthica]
MAVSPVIANSFRPVCCSRATRPVKNSKPTTATKFAPPLPPQRVSAPISSNVAQKYGEALIKPVNVSRRTSKGLSASKEERESAIVDIQNSSDLESALSRSGELLRAPELNVVLRHFGKLNRWNDLSQLFDWMRQQDKTNFASYSSYIKFIGWESNSSKALEIYNSIKDDSIKTNVSVCNSTLHCLIKSGKFDSGLKLFNQMKQAGLVPDIVTYSTLLAGYTKVKGGYSKAMELVREMKSRGLHMDAVVYGTLISVCASNNQCEAAEKYFNQMKGEGHSPNVFHYSSLLNSYAVDGNYRKADELVQDMRAAGLTLNKVILTTLLKVYVKSGLFEKSRELLDELQTLGYAQDEMPYCLLMDGLGKTGKLTEAKSIFDEMRQREVKNDGYSYSIMISALCRNGLLEEAKQLACEYETKYGKYDVVILNSMLSAYCRSREMENVMRMMKKMDESAISPDWNTFHMLIKYFCKEKLYLLAYRTMEDMHRKGHQPDEDLSSSLINRLGKTGAHSEAFSVYTMLRYSKRTISKALHEKILHILLAGGLFKDAYVVVKDNAKFISQPAIRKFATSFMKKGNINLVNDVIKTIHNSGYKIDQGIFHLAISRYIEHPEKKELLFHLLQWMPGQGFPVDSTMRDLIEKNSHLFGRHSLAELLSKHHAVLKANRSHKGKTS